MPKRILGNIPNWNDDDDDILLCTKGSMASSKVKAGWLWWGDAPMGEDIQQWLRILTHAVWEWVA